MATVSSIVAALATALDKLSWVDAVSTAEILPAVTVSSCACLIVPFNQDGSIGVDDLSGDRLVAVHTIQVEFWIKHSQAAIGTTMDKARDAATLAVAQLMADDGTGYTLARDLDFEESILPEFQTHANVPWLVAILKVPVENEVTL